ncbi:hypothetical protein TNCV_3354261 [Trichonephila clavipes]|nr:hypothetical protein TNCV_3354261 [Trichonephila clavipes]
MGDCFALDALGLLLCFRQDMPSLFDILIFEVGMEIIKNFYFNHHCTFQTGSENPLSLWMSQSGWLTTIQQFLRTLTKSRHQLEPRKFNTAHLFLMCVYSFTVFKICEALELKAHLHPLNERPMFKNINPRPVPLVHSVTVFHLCQALNLDVQLAKI